MARDVAQDFWDKAAARDARRRRQRRSAWHGMAFRMESLCLLVFLMISVVILTGVFSDAYTRGNDADDLLKATTLATGGSVNGAEAFAADPTADVPETVYYASLDGALAQVDEPSDADYAVTRRVSSEDTQGGTLYRATIVVNNRDGEVYSVETARYVSDGR